MIPFERFDCISVNANSVSFKITMFLTIFSEESKKRCIILSAYLQTWTFGVLHWLTFIIHLWRYQLQLLFCPMHAVIPASSVKARLICIQVGSWSAWCYKMESRFFILVLVPLGQHKAPLKLVYWSPFPDWILNSQMLMALLWTLCLFKCETQLSLALSRWAWPKEKSQLLKKIISCREGRWGKQIWQVVSGYAYCWKFRLKTG